MNAAADIQLAPVMRLMPEHITSLWPQIEALLRPALAMTATHTSEDVRRALLSMHAQAWGQMDGDTVQAIATTEFVTYPVGLFVRVWHAGALHGCPMNDTAFFDVLDTWRTAHNCIGFEAIGRHGWLRKFPGARVEGLVMRLVPE